VPLTDTLFRPGDVVAVNAPYRHSHGRRGIVADVYATYGGAVRVDVRFKASNRAEGVVMSFAAHELKQAA
jgi:hypothetical protein